MYMKKLLFLLLLALFPLGFVAKALEVGKLIDDYVCQYKVISPTEVEIYRIKPSPTQTAYLPSVVIYEGYGDTEPETFTVVSLALTVQDETIRELHIPATIVNISNNEYGYCLDLLSNLTSIFVEEGNPGFTSDGCMLYSLDKETLLYCSPARSGAYEIPQYVKRIGDSAFRGRENIDLALPSGLESIGKSAFSQSSVFKELTLPETLKSIDNNAFEFCNGLLSVEIPNNVDSIKYGTFLGCRDLRVVTLGKGVKYIGGAAFCNCPNLWQFTFGGSERIIDDGPESINVNAAGGYGYGGAFAYTHLLERLDLPQTLEKIGAYTFSGCGQTKISIPSSVEEISDLAFIEAARLKDIDVAEENPKYSSIDGVLYNYDKTKLIYCPDRKTELVIPASVKEMSSHVIDEASQLRYITVEEGNTEFCSVNGMVYNIDKTKIYMIPPKMETYEFAQTLTEIPDNAMAGTNVETLEIPASVKRIGNNAFKGCSYLKEVKIMSNEFNVGSGAFSNCGSLITVEVVKTFDSPKKEIISSDENTEEDNTIYTIGDEAFYRCMELVSVQLPESTKILGNHVFDDCRGLTSITLPSSIDSIGDGTFYNCTSLTSIEGLEHVTNIGKEAFSRCSSLKDFKLSDSLMVIRENTFENCYALDTVIIPKGVRRIDANAFRFCSSLRNIKLGSSLNSIDSKAFNGCYELMEFEVDPSNTTFSTYEGALYDVDKTILLQFPRAKTSCILPETVINISEYIDGADFSNLKTVVSFASEAPEAGKSTFISVEKGSLYVPVGSKENYQASESWSRFTEIYEMGSIEVALSDSTVEMTQGENLAVQPNVTKDENVTVGSTSWTSSNLEVATVEDGVITAVGEGEATITYTVNVNYGEVELPYTASCLVKVAPVQGVISIEDVTPTPAIYYNLNGMRVNGDALAPGIYVKRQGNKITKVYVK